MKLSLTIDVITNDKGETFMDVGGFFNPSENIGKVAYTYRRGMTVVTADVAGDPVYISIAEADEIDSTFKAACTKRLMNIALSLEEKNHIVKYLLQATRDILESAKRKSLEKSLQLENIELEATA